MVSSSRARRGGESLHRILPLAKREVFRLWMNGPGSRLATRGKRRNISEVTIVGRRELRAMPSLLQTSSDREGAGNAEIFHSSLLSCSGKDVRRVFRFDRLNYMLKKLYPLKKWGTLFFGSPRVGIDGRHWYLCENSCSWDGFKIFSGCYSSSFRHKVSRAETICPK